MRPSKKLTNYNNHLHQAQMANSLIKSLGVDGAIDICTRNDWSGTLNVILKDKRFRR